ncbi:MAG: L-ribulose-5-phosphate 4-epimerase AraD [Spirochaetota bacterium]
MNNRLRELQERVYRANMELFERGLVVYTFGNASGIDRESGVVAIKPSGVDYQDLTPRSMVLLDLEGNRLGGEYNPSSDTRTHLVLYRAYPGIGGVAHTHSRYATAWAQARQPLPCFGTTHADYFHGEIPCTGVIEDGRLRRDYEEETGNLIVDTLRGVDVEHMKAVLVACHGPFTWGMDPGEAVFISVMLEEVARMGLYTRMLDPQAGGIKRALLDKHYLRKHGAGAYYGQPGGGGPSGGA